MKHEKIIASMTLEEKAAFLTGKTFWETKDYPQYEIPSIFLADGPHGIRKQAAASDHLGLNESLKATCFPTAATMANSWNEVLGEEMGEALGEEAASQKVNVLLGPGVNIKRNPRCGRNFEYFSEDPYLAGKMAASYIRGIQKNGTSACVKHFAANNCEERRMVTNSVIDERALREIYLTQFEIAVKEGKVRSVMSSYNKLNGTFTNENEHLMLDILRGEWGYDGVVVTDWGGCNIRVDGVKCGNELEMPSCSYGIDEIVKAVNDGTLDIAYVDQCVDRLLTLIDDTTVAGKKGENGFDIEAHHALARRCAEESIVLMKNEGILPLAEGTSVAVIGDFATEPRYQGAGSSVVNPTKLDSTTEFLKTSGLNVVGIENGFKRYGKKSNGLINKAVKLAKDADVAVLYLGLDEVTEAEGLDRTNIQIPENQIELYKAVKATGKKVVIVLSCGSAVELGWASDADAIVYACLSGQAGAGAVIDVLTGKVNPSGKLSETYISAYDDCPTAENFASKFNIEYRESIYVGYRYYEKAKKEVAFPFGFGLSYTKYEYSDLTATDDGVKFTLKNVGGMDGKEVCQLYVSKKDSAIFRPEKELKGFKKVELKAGESTEVFIPFDDKTFRYFNVATNKWEVEGGAYDIYVAAASNDIRLAVTIDKVGTTDVCPYDKTALEPYYTGEVRNVTEEQFEALYGQKIEGNDYPFYKKKRIHIHENCTVDDLRYAPGWAGRLFAGGIRFAVGTLRTFGARKTANTLVMGVVHQPVRGLAKFGGMSGRQLQGLLILFNGKFFKGVNMVLFKGKEARQAAKAKKKAEKEAKKQA